MSDEFISSQIETNHIKVMLNWVMSANQFSARSSQAKLCQIRTCQVLDILGHAHDITSHITSRHVRPDHAELGHTTTCLVRPSSIRSFDQVISNQIRVL